MANKKTTYKNSKIKWLIYVVLGVLFLYILSDGPAYRLERTRAIPYKTFHSIYLPIIYLCDHSRFADNLFSWYEDFWYSDAKETVKWLDYLKFESTNHPALKPEK
jgi:hypothetical protein